MTYVDTGMNVWEALAGRAPGEPAGPVDPGLWGAVVDRLDPSRARPVLRAGIEAVQLTGARGNDYIMVRSPSSDDRSGYLRMTPEEWQLAVLMDGEHTVTLLVAEFARIAGRLAPDQVHRLVADLAGNRMLDELPMDAFRPVEEARRRALPERAGKSAPAPVRGRRMLVFDVDGVITALYRAGGALLFGRAGAILAAVVAVAGLALFLPTWSRGSRSLFLTGGSYLAGALVLVVLNVLVLALHQLARALAAKHAGREVPAAGLLVSFGIPSLFVDTSDVWMAGRRARMLVAAAGPLGALLLAGLVQLVGLALPMLAGVAFKLAFLCYLNAFFRLSPLLPLDGQYLLTDWLEIPQLRARALAWVGGRLRGRPPRWSSLDREGRLIALYGYIAVAWLALAVALAVLVWSDRVSGLATGLWHDGVPGKLLFLLIVLGVAAPVVHFLLARLARWWGASRRRRAENDREADSPRRLAALRASDLGGLPEPALNGLAARARWEHPPTGRRIVQSGDAQAAVYVVVDGGLAARKPGDPPGTIRHHVGPGGVVGLVDAVAGRTTQLDWHTSGTTLLAVPAATVATVVGPLPGPPPQDRAEAEALFADTPALADLAVDQRLALVASAHPVDLEAGAPVILHGPTHAVVVESGVIALSDGVELRRGTLVGPVGEGDPGMVAQTRTPVRLWVLPDASDLPPLVGSTRRPVAAARSSASGVRSYPPLAVPAGPPEEPVDPAVDGDFQRKMWWVVAALLIVALVAAGMTFRAGPAWAEMPGGSVRLSVDDGQVTASVDGGRVSVSAGGARYLRSGDRIDVPSGASGRLTFPGGAFSLLCGGSRVEIGPVRTDGGRHRTPSGTLNLLGGSLLADTTSGSGAYGNLRLTVSRQQGDVVSSGAARFAVSPGGVAVADGAATDAGQPVPAATAPLSCGDGTPSAPLPSSGASPSETEVPFPSELPPSTSPSVSPSATVVTPSVTPSATRPSTPSLTPEPTEATVTPPRPTHPPTTRPTTTRPPATTPTTTSPTPTPSASSSTSAPSPTESTP